MGYRIRYGVEAKRFRWVRFQVIVSLALLVVVLVTKQFGGGEAMRAAFCPGETVWEEATAELARAVSGGEGWYWSLARFCGRIIHGAA